MLSISFPRRPPGQGAASVNNLRKTPAGPRIAVSPAVALLHNLSSREY